MSLADIYRHIESYEVEQAYDKIILLEEKQISNSIYWALRGDLCVKIQEYNTAINCYKKSIELEKLNLYTIDKLVDLYKLINDKHNEKLYTEMSKELKHSFSIDYILNMLKNDFIGVDESRIIELVNNKSIYIYIGNNILIRKNSIILIDEYKMKNLDERIVIPFNINYLEKVKTLAKRNVDTCIVASKYGKFIGYITLDKEIMNNIKEENYKNTITMSIYNAGDSNVYAINKYIPKKYKYKYNINVINGSDVFNLENMIKVPLISSMTVSGHGVFLSYPYPQLTYNLEVGHGPMSFKASGNMEKTYKNFAFTPKEYNNVDKMCATSTMDTILLASFVNIPENKFLISGMPRTDTLLKSNGKENLEKLIKIKIDNKKVIFNMPTFHKHENSGKEDGNSKLNNFMKVHNFNYAEFDKFLGENNFICVMKVHHAEENLLKSKEFKSDNIHFIFNDDLKNLNLDLYEILNASDLLITDYSTIYSDFLFMNKPTVFVNTDIEEYRAKRGLALEPYEFWTAGPKVKEQDKLQEEIIKSLNDKNYYKQKREELRTVYHANFDDKSSERVWEFIDETMNKLNSLN